MEGIWGLSIIKARVKNIILQSLQVKTAKRGGTKNKKPKATKKIGVEMDKQNIWMIKKQQRSAGKITNNGNEKSQHYGTNK